MISEGQLYLSYFPCERWAFADVNRNQNFENVRNAGFHIEKPSGYEDAIFSTPVKSQCENYILLTKNLSAK